MGRPTTQWVIGPQYFEDAWAHRRRSADYQGRDRVLRRQLDDDARPMKPAWVLNILDAHAAWGGGKLFHERR